MKNRIISISGKAGAGKSAVGKELSKKLNAPFFSIGNTTREFAARRGMDIHEFQAYARAHPGTDELLDEQFKATINNTPASVIDYRLAFHFYPKAFHVFLMVSETEALNRIKSRGDISDGQSDSGTNEVLRIRNRNHEMRDRLKELYNVDFTDETNYTLVIDTSSLSIDEVVSEIQIAYQEFLVEELK
jgi:cytidylate kinase